MENHRARLSFDTLSRPPGKGLRPAQEAQGVQHDQDAQLTQDAQGDQLAQPDQLTFKMLTFLGGVGQESRPRDLGGGSELVTTDGYRQLFVCPGQTNSAYTI